MNKNDLKLIGFILIVVFVTFISFSLFKSNKESKAVVYYEDKNILTIDLNINNTYEVEGYNGKVILKVNKGKIKVDSEKSPLHLCSKQGYISKPYETIICLPNKIIIKIETNDEYDTIVK